MEREDRQGWGGGAVWWQVSTLWTDYLRPEVPYSFIFIKMKSKRWHITLTTFLHPGFFDAWRKRYVFPAIFKDLINMCEHKQSFLRLQERSNKTINFKPNLEFFYCLGNGGWSSGLWLFSCLFLHSNELYFIETLTGINPENERFPFSCEITLPNITGWSAEQFQNFLLDDVIYKVSFLASEDSPLNFARPYKVAYYYSFKMKFPLRKEQAGDFFSWILTSLSLAFHL